MADVPKLLGQQAPTAGFLVDLYAVPANLSTVISSVTVCNRGGVDSAFRLAIAQGGVASDPKQYVYYDLVVPANDTFSATLGITLNANDVVRCYAQFTSLTFNLFGIESDGNPTPGDIRQTWIFTN